MKALTCYQPHATLIAIRAKKIETRSWPTKYRGPLAIHSAKRFPVEYRSLWLEEPFQSALAAAGIVTIRLAKVLGAEATQYLLNKHLLPLGCVVATCELIDCVEIRSLGESVWEAYEGKEPKRQALAGLASSPNISGQFFYQIEEPELSFGDYTPGRFAWILENVKRLDIPIPARGMQRLWEWDEDQ